MIIRSEINEFVGKISAQIKLHFPVKTRRNVAASLSRNNQPMVKTTATLCARLLLWKIIGIMSQLPRTKTVFTRGFVWTEEKETKRTAAPGVKQPNLRIFPDPTRNICLKYIFKKKTLPSVALETLNSFSLSFSSSTWSLNRCTGQWPLSVMSCRFVSGLPSSRARVKPLSKTSLYVILSLLLSLVFWSKDFDTNAVSSSMVGCVAQ